MGSRQKYRIGILVDRARTSFHQTSYNSLLESAAAYKNYSLVIRETDGRFFSTVKNTDILLNDRVDMIINFSLCVESLGYIGEKCRSRGVKLITVDLQCPDSVYFGADNAVAGTMAGKHTIDFIQRYWHGQLDKIAVLSRHSMDLVTNRRVMSMVEKVQAEIYCSSPEPEIIEWDYPNDKPREKLIQLLRSMPANKYLLIISFNLTNFLTSYDLIVQYRDANNTIMVGQNFNEQIRAMMKTDNSPVLGCVNYYPEKYGPRILNIADRMLQGEPVDAENYTTLTWISKESVLR
jgi:ABC-type sugar transport system substrate-binding protein